MLRVSSYGCQSNPVVIFQQSIGLSRNTSLLLGGFNGVEYFLASIIPVFLIDRVGRRPLMLFAAAGQTACMIVLAVTVQNGGVSAGKAAASMLFLFNTFFACGWLAMYFLICRSQC
jgi:Sugar (and other) transporter